MSDDIVECDGQLDLLADRLPPQPIGKVRRDHPDTSHAAAEAIAGAMRPMHRQVLRALYASAMTDEQLIVSTQLAASTLRPRRVELVDKGLVTDSGERGRTSSGRSAIRWQLTLAGRAVAAQL